jgi:hypothetical protein
MLCQNEWAFIFFVMKLFVIMWSGDWMVNDLTCHHGGEGFQSFLRHA